MSSGILLSKLKIERFLDTINYTNGVRDISKKDEKRLFINISERANHSREDKIFSVYK